MRNYQNLTGGHGAEGWRAGKAPREGAVMCVLGRAAKGCTYLQAVRGEVADSSVGLEKGVKQTVERQRQVQSGFSVYGEKLEDECSQIFWRTGKKT